MASIQRVASTFFRAIDEKQGTPYVFRDAHQPTSTTTEDIISFNDDQSPTTDLSPEDSDQEELDRFIAEIEDAANREFEEEEEAEKEEVTRIRYLGKDDINNMGMMRGREDYRSRMRTMDVRKWDSGDEDSEEDDHELDDDVRSRPRSDRPNKNEMFRMQSASEGDGNMGMMRGRDYRGSRARTMDVRKWDSDDEDSEEDDHELDEDVRSRPRSNRPNKNEMYRMQNASEEGDNMGMMRGRDYRGNRGRVVDVRKWDSGDDSEEDEDVRARPEKYQMKNVSEEDDDRVRSRGRRPYKREMNKFRDVSGSEDDSNEDVHIRLRSNMHGKNEMHNGLGREEDCSDSELYGGSEGDNGLFDSEDEMDAKARVLKSEDDSRIDHSGSEDKWNIREVDGFKKKNFF